MFEFVLKIIDQHQWRCVHALMSVKETKGVVIIISHEVEINSIARMAIGSMFLTFMFTGERIQYFRMEAFYFSIQNNITNRTTNIYLLSSNQFLFMKAYAVVKKPTPASYQHIFKITKQQPKITVQPIQQNRMARPHKYIQPLPMHQISNKGSYYKFNNQPSEPSQRPKQKVDESILSEPSSNLPMKEQKLNAAPQIPQFEKQENESIKQEQKVVRVRTKRLFQQFPSAKKQEQVVNSSKDQNEQKLNITPVDFLNEYLIVHKKQEEQQQIIQSHSPSYLYKDIIYEQNSNNLIFEQSNTQMLQNSSPKVRKSHLFQPFSPNKRPIFEQFQERKEHKTQQFTFKDQKNPQRFIKIKIYELENIAAFDI